VAIEKEVEIEKRVEH